MVMTQTEVTVCGGYYEITVPLKIHVMRTSVAKVETAIPTEEWMPIVAIVLQSSGYVLKYYQ